MLFSLFGNQPDVRKTATSNFKHHGERIYLVGTTYDELGASEVAFHLRERGDAEGIGGQVPLLEDPERQLNVYRKLSASIQQGLVRTAHDCSEGGLAVAVAEMCIGGRCGAIIDIDGIGHGDAFTRLWSESLGRIVVSVEAQHELAFVEMMEGSDVHLIGMVTESSDLIVEDGYDMIIQADVDELTTAWKGALDMTGAVE